MFRNKFLWFGAGLVITFGQSFFLISWPAYLWAICLGWFFSAPWFLLLGLGLINDLLQLHYIGRSMTVFLIIGLATQILKQILGWSKTYQIKVSDF